MYLAFSKYAKRMYWVFFEGCLIYAWFLERWDTRQVVIYLLQLSIRYLFVMLQEKLAAQLSRWPGSTSRPTPIDGTSVTDFFNAKYRRIQKPMMFIIDNYPTF